MPRLLINRQIVGQRMGPNSFDFEPESNRRDALFLGDCDDGARQLAALMGWQTELADLVAGGKGQKQKNKGCFRGMFSR